MKKNKKEVLDAVIDALNNDEGIFWGFTVDPQNDGLTVITDSGDTDDINEINAVLMGMILQNIVQQRHLDKLISVDDIDLAPFANSIVKATDERIKDTMHSFSEQVNQENPVKVLKVDKQKGSGVIALDVSDGDALKNNEFFQSMPKELKEFALRKVKEVSNQHDE